MLWTRSSPTPSLRSGLAWCRATIARSIRVYQDVVALLTDYRLADINAGAFEIMMMRMSAAARRFRWDRRMRSPWRASWAHALGGVPLLARATVGDDMQTTAPWVCGFGKCGDSCCQDRALRRRCGGAEHGSDGVSVARAQRHAPAIRATAGVLLRRLDAISGSADLRYVPAYAEQHHELACDRAARRRRRSMRDAGRLVHEGRNPRHGPPGRAGQSANTHEHCLCDRALLHALR